MLQSLLRLIFPETKTPDLDTLSRRSMIILRRKRTMRCPSSDSMKLRIELLDQQSLVGLHVRGIIPVVRSRIGFDLPRLRARFGSEVVASLSVSELLWNIRVNGSQVFLVHGAGIAEGHVVASNRVQGPPEINDRPSALLQRLRVGLCFQSAVPD